MRSDGICFVGELGTDFSCGGVLRNILLAANRAGYPVGARIVPAPGAKTARFSEQRHATRLRHFQDVGYPVTFSTFTPSDLPGPYHRFDVIDYQVPRRVIDDGNAKQVTFLGISEHTSAFIRRQGAERVETVPLGVDPRQFCPGPRDWSVLEKFVWAVPGHLDDQTMIFGHYGFLQPRKGTSTLLQAYAERFTRWDNVCLVIQGQAAEWGQDMRDAVLSAGCRAPVLFNNARLNDDDLVALNRLLTVGVFPNWLEGFGLCGLECLACGTPVVLPAHSGNLEYLDESACWALRQFGTERAQHPDVNDSNPVDWHPTDVEELAELLGRLYFGREDVAEKAARAREVALRHTWTQTAHRLAEVLGVPPREPATDGRVSLVMLTMGNLEVTGRAVRAAARSMGDYDFTLIDNGSDCGPQLQKLCGELGVTYVDRHGQTDLGAIARNLVLETATTEFCATLDNDAEPDPKWLVVCRDYLRRHPEVGLVGVISAREDGGLEHSGAHQVWDREGDLACRHYGDGHSLGEARWMVSRPVPAVPSLCWVVRTEALRQVGCLRPEYFPVWWEDIDVCRAMWEHGWAVHVVTGTHCTHFRPHTTTAGKMAERDHSREVYLSWWAWDPIGPCPVPESEKIER